ncbi:MAG: DeoR/GlpR family DNA-binding transcription regulator [Cyanobacteria bacterium]|nr:DeoR/GlpR family DNA-binding transcription regulator [Cyanobacteriota bacterium]
MEICNRRKEIANLFNNNNNISVIELSDLLKVSVPTIYRDLKFLVKENLIDINKDKYKLFEFNVSDHNFFNRLHKNQRLKKIIAKEAAKLINDSETIALDASSSCFYLCRELKKLNKKITIITNSIFIPIELINYPNINILSIGGILDREVGSFMKSPVEIFLNNIIINKFFQSCFSISEEIGILDEIGKDDIEVRKTFMKFAQKNILLADSSKFTHKGTYNWVNFDKLKNIISDEYLDQKVADKLKKQGINLILAREGGD